MKNSFCWLQLQSTKFEEIKKFYTSPFDWKFKEIPNQEHTYTHIDTGEEPRGGIMPTYTEEDQAPSHRMPYVRVSDLEAYTEKAQQLGAHILSLL